MTIDQKVKEARRMVAFGRRSGYDIKLVLDICNDLVDMRNDAIALATAGQRVIHADERGQGTPFQAAMYDLGRALDRPGVVEILPK